MEAITDINPQALYAAEAISAYLEKDGHSDHDIEGNIRFIWQMEQEGSLVELHMIKTTEDGMYALAVAAPLPQRAGSTLVLWPRYLANHTFAPPH